jgi:vancomycin permeability regulator SanA
VAGDRRSVLTLAADAAARGFALLFGAFSLVSAIADWRSGAVGSDLWWLDMRWMPTGMAVAVGLLAAIALTAWALVPDARPWRRVSTTTAALALAAIAASNGVGFYGAWRTGGITPWAPLPASWLYAAAFAFVAWRVWARQPGGRRAVEGLAFVGALLLLLAVFPLVQMAFFGTTDYRRPADVAVIFGAKALHKQLSTVLEDRVRTGADLYRQGLVPALLMSGGTGDNGVDETVAMRRRAMQLGVPASAILLDPHGMNTDDSVADTTAMMRSRSMKRVLAVSQFFHLPRIKLAYGQAGWDVATVPATASLPVLQTPYLMVREIPGFWVYWARAQARAILGGS